jgi:16S rRNA (cytidine1402-2'-O)-methyltransferase
MPGRLVICATPIGNLSDASPRLAEALRDADLVYAEDTRRARVLLDHVGADTPVRSYFVGNEAARAEELVDRLSDGQSIVLISDAGTPVVADPGMTAVAAARKAGADLTTVPGPSAVTASLAVSGFGADRFTFEGFLPRKGARRAERLAAIGDADHTVVFFTTGPRVVDDLAGLATASDGDRQVVVCRELTKLHEEIWAGSLSGASAHWAGAVRKGEFTVVVEAGAPKAVTHTIEEALAVASRRVEDGEKRSTVAKEVARELGVDRGELYDRLTRSPSQD